MKLRKIFIGLAIIALLILIVKKAVVISTVAGPVGALIVAGAVAVLAVIFILVVLLPLLGLIFAGVSFVILLVLLGLAVSAPFALLHGHHFTLGSSDKMEADGEKDGEVREMPPFDRLHVKGDMTLLVVSGGGHAVAVKGDAEGIDALKSDVKDGLLTVSQESGLNLGEDTRVAVSAESLNEFHLSGASKASLQRLDAETLSLDLDGAGQVEAAGRCGKLIVHMKGTGKLNARDLQCDDVTLVMEGVGAAKIFAAKSLNVKISGLGQVTYAGNPAKIDRNISALGRLSPE
jgi:hypothetical protein